MLLYGATRHTIMGDIRKTSLIAMFMGPTWGPSGADRTHVGPMLAPWTLVSLKVLAMKLAAKFDCYNHCQELWKPTQGLFYTYLAKSYWSHTIKNPIRGRFRAFNRDSVRLEFFERRLVDMRLNIYIPFLIISLSTGLRCWVFSLFWHFYICGCQVKRSQEKERQMYRIHIYIVSLIILFCFQFSQTYMLYSWHSA